jgi:MFS family permease
VNVSILHSPSEASLPDSRRAWVMVLVAFTVGFVVFGTMYSFGAFFAPMAGEFRASRAATSAFFSITGLIFYLAGSVAGHFGDRFGPVVMTALGAAVMGGGLVLTGFIGQMWEGYLTYGIGVGVGAACAYVPTLAISAGGSLGNATRRLAQPPPVPDVACWSFRHSRPHSSSSLAGASPA